MSFYEWLLKQVGRDDVIGDLAGDAGQDANFSKHATNLAQLHNYLEEKGVSVYVLRALSGAYAEWSRSK